MFLADGIPTEALSFADIGKWVAIFGFLFAIWKRAGGNKVQITPQPVGVKHEGPVSTQPVANYATVEALNKNATAVEDVDKEVTKLRAEMSAMELRLKDEGEERVRRLHIRVDSLKDDIGDLKTEIGLMPSKTVAMLHDAKGIL